MIEVISKAKRSNVQCFCKNRTLYGGGEIYFLEIERNALSNWGLGQKIKFSQFDLVGGGCEICTLPIFAACASLMDFLK